jgi:hypothetical protein
MLTLNNNPPFMHYPFGVFDTLMVRMDFDVDKIEHGMEGKDHVYIVTAHDDKQAFRVRVVAKGVLTDDELLSKVGGAYVKEKAAKL